MSASFSTDEVLRATQALGHSLRSMQFAGISTDTRHLTPGHLFVALKGERFDAHDFVAEASAKGAAGVIVERIIPGLEGPVFQVQNSLRALGQLALWHREKFQIPVGAVTGSNGKTTTKELVASILATRGAALKTMGNLNNEIGVPLTLFELGPHHKTAIIEMGMNHTGEIERMTAMAKPDAGLITVVQPAHLEGVGSIEGVARAKTELFRGLAADGVAVVNLDDERIVQHSASLTCRRLTFGRDSAADVRLCEVKPLGLEGQYLAVEFQKVRHHVRLSLLGTHNALNATGAFALGVALGIVPEQCAAGLANTRGFSQRLEVKTSTVGATVIDDCYNANPESMKAALETLIQLADRKRSIAVLGDMRELGAAEAEGHLSVLREAQRVDVIFCVGDLMKTATRNNRKAQMFETIEALNLALKNELKKDDVVLVKASRGMHLERVVAALTSEVESQH
jgi:UDP-N-acetylmuramoyl-tripeptide--D-alanyl-D-alanine ligase